MWVAMRQYNALMAKTDFQSVDEYIAAQPEASRAALEGVRRAIRKALPKAEERISYQIAAYRTEAGNVIFFAGWKQHYSVYPVSPALAARFGAELEPYQAQKDTLRFPLSEPVPAKLIERVARARAAEAEEYVAAKRAAKGVGKTSGKRAGKASGKRAGKASKRAGKRTGKAAGKAAPAGAARKSARAARKKGKRLASRAAHNGS